MFGPIHSLYRWRNLVEPNDCSAGKLLPLTRMYSWASGQHRSAAVEQAFGLVRPLCHRCPALLAQSCIQGISKRVARCQSRHLTHSDSLQTVLTQLGNFPFASPAAQTRYPAFFNTRYITYFKQVIWAACLYPVVFPIQLCCVLD